VGTSVRYLVIAWQADQRDLPTVRRLLVRPLNHVVDVEGPDRLPRQGWDELVPFEWFRISEPTSEEICHVGRTEMGDSRIERSRQADARASVGAHRLQQNCFESWRHWELSGGVAAPEAGTRTEDEVIFTLQDARYDAIERLAIDERACSTELRHMRDGSARGPRWIVWCCRRGLALRLGRAGSGRECQRGRPTGAAPAAQSPVRRRRQAARLRIAVALLTWRLPAPQEHGRRRSGSRRRCRATGGRRCRAFPSQTGGRGAVGRP